MKVHETEAVKSRQKRKRREHPMSSRWPCVTLPRTTMIKRQFHLISLRVRVNVNMNKDMPETCSLKLQIRVTVKPALRPTLDNTQFLYPS